MSFVGNLAFFNFNNKEIELQTSTNWNSDKFTIVNNVHLCWLIQH